MSEFFSALLEHGFLQTAIAAALLASIGCGVMGSYVVVKRIAFIAGGIAHSVLGGMGAAVYYGADPLAGALAAAILAALLIGWVRLSWRAQEDTLIGALWAIGMAIGIPTFYVRRNSRNRFLLKILRQTDRVRNSRRYPGYLRVYRQEYCRALLKVLREDAGDLIEMFNFT